MFIIDTSTKLPYTWMPIKEAFPDVAASEPNIAIINTSSNRGIPLNAKMLREALLNSKDFLREQLGIIVSDRTIVEAGPIKPKPTKPKETTPKPKQPQKPVVKGEDVIYE